MKELRESSPEEDLIRISYTREGREELVDRIVGMVQVMFESLAERWEELLRVGIMVPLFKGARGVNNYRGVCLLAMGSKILDRVIAKRLNVWAEKRGILDENQAGFRKGRSMADLAQVMMKMQNDVEDGRKRVEGSERVLEEGKWPEARLLDPRKAYTRVNKPGLLGLLERFSLGEKMLRVVRRLHETTMCKVRGNEGVSEGWLPERSLRGGGGVLDVFDTARRLPSGCYEAGGGEVR